LRTIPSLWQCKERGKSKALLFPHFHCPEFWLPAVSRSPLPTGPPCRAPQPRLKLRVCAARMMIWKSLRSCLVRLRLSCGELSPQLSKVGSAANQADFSQVGDGSSSQEYLSESRTLANWHSTSRRLLVHIDCTSEVYSHTRGHSFCSFVLVIPSSGCVH
jgi:hypothetical protein